MTSQPTCDLCDRPVPDQSYVCSRCTEAYGGYLSTIASLAGEVEAAVAKLVGHGPATSGGGGHGHPLPVDLDAAEKAAAVGNTVSTWARHVSLSRGIEVLRDRPPQAGPVCRTNTCRHRSCAEIRAPRREVGIAVAARFIAEHLNWLRHRREAAEALAELRDAAGQIQRIVGGRLPRWYAGQCWELLENAERCTAELYATPGASTVRCPDCDTVHETARRRSWLLDEARDVLAHAELIARALTALELEGVTGSRVRNLAARGRLLAHGVDAADRPLYRVGDVLELIHEQARVEAERVAKREARAEAKAARRAESEAA